MSANAIAIIPARLGSTRFPAKALADETGKPLVVHVCEQASKADSIGRVVVATDDTRIQSAVESHGFESVMTSIAHTNGTSRLAEACERLSISDNDLIVNVQGDEPEIEPNVIDAAVFAARQLQGIGAGTVVSPLRSSEEFSNPNIVKSVLGFSAGIENVTARRALYFSRATVPYPRETPAETAFRHVGLYAYRVHAIHTYLELEPSPLELTESLEQLRWLAHGYPVLAGVVHSAHSGIDTPEQYRAFVERYRQKNNEN